MHARLRLHCRWLGGVSYQLRASVRPMDWMDGVVCSADDYGHTDIGYHNEHYDNLLRTPHLDTLAATGIKLEQY